MEKKAKELFEELGYEYSYVKHDDCEDTIVYTNKENDRIVQFNLVSQIVTYKIKNEYKQFDELHFLATKELIRAVYKQIDELKWYNN